MSHIEVESLPPNAVMEEFPSYDVLDIVFVVAAILCISLLFKNIRN